MKTDISRWSLDPKKNYSGVYQQQGRMISDADWNELVEILKLEIRDSLKDVVGSGGTKAVIQSDGKISAKAEVYVDGIRGVINPNDVAIKFTEQPDFPCDVKPNGDSLFYVDLWERTVTGVEDSDLNDSGLNGADTCTRTQTLTQIKWCENNQVSDWTALPRVGNALLKLTLLSEAGGTAKVRSCGNQLFRLEVHDVIYENLNLTEITLKWSTENGARHYRIDQYVPPQEFKTGDWIYEFYSDVSEKHLGLNLATNFKPKRLPLREAYSVPTSNELIEIDAEVGKRSQKPLYVRRWDGYCKLKKNAKDEWELKIDENSKYAGKDRAVGIPQSDADSTGYAVVAGGKLTINLTLFKVTLTLCTESIEIDVVRPDVDSIPDVGTIHGGAIPGHGSVIGVVLPVGDRPDSGNREPMRNIKRFLAGDYWLAVVRQNAHHDEHEDLRVEVLNGGYPLGILHHYLPLPQLKSDDAIRRRFSFPPLTCLSADKIGYDPNEKKSSWQPSIPSGAHRLDCSGTLLPVNLKSAIDELISRLHCLDCSKVSRSGDSMGDLTVSALTVNGMATVGSFKMETGKNEHYVLTCDAGGYGTWKKPMPLGWNLISDKILTTATEIDRVGIGSGANDPGDKFVVTGGRIGQLESGTFGDDWGKWVAIGIADIGVQPSNNDYYGLKVNWDSDSLVLGLKNYDHDKKDAIIAWGDNNDDNLRFIKPDGTEAMVVTGDGKIGIGTDPGSKIDIKDGAIGGNYGLTPKYANWCAYGNGDGGAAIYNSNEKDYNALMIVGNNSADGSTRVVKVWDVLDVRGKGNILIQGVAPFMLHSYNSQGTVSDSTNTRESSSVWQAVIAGFKTTGGNIDEGSDSSNNSIIKCYMEESDATWHIHTDFKSAEPHESWTVWVLFIRKELF
ncbi:MAG: hypothetical protein HGA78_00800 [Nitrospirales bacterium]|nr:hypothetical protein [Nitrospirales bacterium]